MHIIKLNAIDSTNSYLKKLAKETPLESYTAVVAKHQTKGRGQLGTAWLSEDDKNLTFSLIIHFEAFNIEQQFYLSMAVSLGVLDVVKKYVKIPLMVKWPNDILAGKDKVAGILIENLLRGNLIKYSVVGIGLNVNQTEFPNNLGSVSSLKRITGNNYQLDDLMKAIIKSIEHYVDYIENSDFKKLKELYIVSLYNYKKPVMFEEKEGVTFLGKIVDISEEGKLVVELENETTRNFNLKEIKFASRS